MARDLSEQERLFVQSLASDTGSDLAGWMHAIAASGLTNRNDIIDWLRHKGFTFANASWLERIHHNGGQLIYGENPPFAAVDRGLSSGARLRGETQAVAAPAASRGSDATPPQTVPPFAPPPSAPAEWSGPVPSANDADVAALLTAAKGLRPLAELILREIDAIVPATSRTLMSPFLFIANPKPFAALLPAPRDVRLFADFGPASRDRTRKAEAGRILPPFHDVLVLNDARQIDARFRELVAAAYTRALE